MLAAAIVGFAKKANGKKDWRPPFKYSDDVVWIIYY
jgi:hypothetical protein